MSNVAEKVIQLRRQRAGKKGSITKRVNQLRRLVSEGGSRTKIKFLHEALKKVYKDLTAVCDQFEAAMTPTQEDIDWLENVTMTVDECTSEVMQYLEDRKDEDASTTVSMTTSWVEAHAAGRDEYPVDVSTEELEKINDAIGHVLPESSVVVDKHENLVSHTDAISEPHGLESLFSAWNRQEMLPNPLTSSVGLSVHNAGPQFSTWREHDRSSFVSDPMQQGFGIRPPSSTFQVSSAPSMPYLKPILRPPSFFPQFSQHNTVFPSVYRSHTPTQPRTVFSSAANHSAASTHVPPRNPLLNQVDSWIDQLDESQRNYIPNPISQGISADLTMAWLVQQSLPRSKIPTFNGSALSWVPFITKFHTLIHNQGVLNDEQRSMYLLDHLDGDARRSVSGYSHDSYGYILSLKRLKYLFGQRSKIAQAYLAKVVRGKQVPDDDVNGLVEFFYTVSDCLVALRQLNYASDLFSSDTLRQAIRRLPNKLHMKWAEHSLRIRERNAEPNLMDLESWLQSRVLAYKETYQPEKRTSNSNKPRENSDAPKTSLIGTTMTKAIKCSFCEAKHKIGKCESFGKLTPLERFEAAKKKNLCFNCLSTNHQSPKCLSGNTCFVTNCSDKHHTLLHEYFTRKEKTEVVDGEKKSSYNAMVRSTKKKVFLQVVPVVLHSSGDGSSIKTYALLDDGSESTLIRDDIAKKLNLHGKRQLLNVSTVIENLTNLFHLKKSC